jgi:hypothetical protein
MAVTRFKADEHWLNVMSMIMEEAGEARGARELKRATTRPGLMAELTEHEFEVLFRAANWPTPVAAELDAAWERLNRARAEEHVRPRGTDLLQRYYDNGLRKKDLPLIPRATDHDGDESAS